MGIKVIVGADRGIAFALSNILHERGDKVLAAVMGDGADLSSKGIEVVTGFDVTSGPAVDKLAKRIADSGETVDWLVHVAGIMHLDRLDTIDFDDARLQFEINTLGPLRTIRALRGFLASGSKVGIFTSRVGSLADNTGGDDYAYRISKVGANMVARNLSIDLGKEGVAVQALHPGMVGTNLLDVMTPEARKQAESFTVTPEQAAANVASVLDALTVENAGQFQHANGQILPW